MPAMGTLQKTFFLLDGRHSTLASAGRLGGD
jgi:hypothetical protein